MVSLDRPEVKIFTPNEIEAELNRIGESDN